MVYSRFSLRAGKSVLILISLMTLLDLVSCGGDDDEEDFDEDEPVASAPTQNPAVQHPTLLNPPRLRPTQPQRQFRPWHPEGPLNHLQTLPLSPQQMETSIAASPRPGITTDILERIAAHLKPDDARPIVNIILDRFRVPSEGGFSADEYFEHVSISIVGNVGDALEAAGYRTILTNDSPWEGGKSDLTHILTPGGNEDTEEEVGMGRFTGLTLKTSVPSL